MNFRLYFSYAFFYLRVGLVALIVLPVRLLLALLPPARRYGTEAALLQRCNRLFRRIVPVEPYLKRDSYYAYLDTADFRTLCRRLSLPDDWFVGKRLLDVGCGHGKLSRLLALSGAAHVDGIDIAASSIAYANGLQEREPVGNLDLKIGSVYELDFPDHHFDAVVSQVVFEHIDKIPLALGEIYRVLKPGGVFYFTIDAFRSRYGAHMAHFVLVPWPLLLFSEQACEKVWCDALTRIKRQMPDGDVPDYFQWCMSLPSINRVSLCDLENMIAASGFEVVASTEFADEKPLRTLFPWLRNFPRVYEYIRGSKAFVLRKPVS
ncbi:MAG: class I SAM-dependent methyltransferase [Verrucomicrobia bacterium]|nr:class I SAM-dependent methyltransferase [Verrucomicrobiota bacterium]